MRETLRLAQDGAHRAAAALVAAPLPGECRARLVELHREQAAPLLSTLGELGVPEPDLTARLLGGALRAAMEAIEGGAPHQTVSARTLALVRSAVRSR